jgi:hypothetical protein
MEKDILRLINGLQLLSSHRLSPSLTRPEFLAAATLRLRSAMKKMGLQLAIGKLEDLYQCETSHLMFANGTLRIILHVPAFRPDSILDIHEYIPMPIPLPNHKEMYVLPTPSASLLAISETASFFRVLSIDTLKLCHQVSGLYYCNGQNYFDKRITDSCLPALFFNRPSSIQTECRFTTRPREDFVAQLDSHLFILYQATENTIELRCGNHRVSHSFQGIRKISVPSGCRVTTTSFLLDGSYSVVLDPITVTMRLTNLTQLFSPHVTEEFVHLMGTIGHIGSSSGLHIRDIVAESSRRRNIHRGFISIGTISVVLLFVVGIIIFLRYRHFQKRRRPVTPELIILPTRAEPPPPANAPARPRPRSADSE